jgi:pyruvate dehydrogenase E1 component alpha subunit
MLTQLQQMLEIREVELLLSREASIKTFGTPIHLGIGQEAIAVGISKSIKIGDTIFGNHRSHAHYLAQGGSVLSLFAEILGKASGCSGGRGGSMHLSNPSVGVIGTMPIVAGTIPLAAGAALSHKVRKNGQVAVSYFGDGAVEEGVFHETLNMASQMNLPILFVCENNEFSSHLHVTERQPSAQMSRFAIAHGIKWQSVDGNNLQEVSQIAKELIEYTRLSSMPAFLEAHTYRLYGHVGFEIDETVGLNRREDLVKWRERDPITREISRTLDLGAISESSITKVRDEIREKVSQDWNQALDSPYPEKYQLLRNVYFEESI